MGEPFTFTLKSMHMDKAEIMRRRGIDSGGRVQRYVDNAVLDFCADYIPFDTGELNRSGERNTRIGSGEVIYDTPMQGVGITVTLSSRGHQNVAPIGLNA